VLPFGSVDGNRLVTIALDSQINIIEMLVKQHLFLSTSCTLIFYISIRTMDI